MAAAMRPFPARMVDEQGIEKYQEYETLGGESELTPLNAAASSLRPENQAPGADSGLAGKVNLGAGLPACVWFAILGQHLSPAGLQERSVWPVGVLACLVLLAVALVAAVVAVNPGIFKRELKSQFLLVSTGSKRAAILQINMLSNHVHTAVQAHGKHIAEIDPVQDNLVPAVHTNMGLPAILVKSRHFVAHFQPQIVCAVEAKVPQTHQMIPFVWSLASLVPISTPVRALSGLPSQP